MITQSGVQSPINLTGPFLTENGELLVLHGFSQCNKKCGFCKCGSSRPKRHSPDLCGLSQQSKDDPDGAVVAHLTSDNGLSERANDAYAWSYIICRNAFEAPSRLDSSLAAFSRIRSKRRVSTVRRRSEGPAKVSAPEKRSSTPIMGTLHDDVYGSRTPLEK